ncbi:TPA: hypothetical protein HA361_06255 [Candidatus Woesearchaeota archaeon]|nr:hypothetical protein [Candidatus Woesearchaeota archaeon]HII68631.1 hypothetical protein [Candidatus Woesearchaeota archaeon]
MLKELQNVFDSAIKSLEVMYVMRGMKPCTRILADIQKKGSYLAFLKRHQLHAEESDFLIKKDDSKGYSDKGTILPKGAAEGYAFLYIAREQAIAKKAKMHEHQQEHIALGEVLGYPACCCRFFARHYDTQSQKSNDYTLLALDNSTSRPFPYETNIAMRHFDISLLSHFPCSYHCAASIAIAKKHLAVVRSENERTAERILKMLRNTILYHESGILVLIGAVLAGNMLSYGQVDATMHHPLLEKLRDAGSVEIIDSHTFRIGGEECSDFGVMVFA